MSKQPTIDQKKLKECIKYLNSKKNSRIDIPDIYLMELMFLEDYKSIAVEVMEKKMSLKIFNLEGFDDYYIEKLIDHILSETKIQGEMTHLFTDYLLLTQKMEYLNLIEQKLTLDNPTNCSFMVVELFRFLSALQENEKKFFHFLVELVLPNIYEFVENYHLESRIYESLQILFDQFPNLEEKKSFYNEYMRKTMKRVPLGEASMNFIVTIYEVIPKEDIPKFLENVKKEIKEDNITGSFLEFITIVFEGDKNNRQIIFEMVQYLVQLYFDFEARSENCDEFEYEELLVLIQDFESFFQIIFEKETEIAEQIVGPTLMRNLNSDDETVVVFTLKLITEFSSKTKNIDLLNKLLELFKSKKYENYFVILALNSFFNLMMKNNMYDDLQLLFKDVFQLLSDDDGQKVNLAIATLRNIFNVSDEMKYKINIDLNFLCKKIYLDSINQSDNYLSYMELLGEINHEYSIIDYENEYVKKLFEVVLKGAETGDESVKYIHMNALQFFVYAMKYSTRKYLSRMMKMCVSTLRNSFTVGINSFHLRTVLLLIVIIIQAFEDEIEHFIAGTNFFEMIYHFTNDENDFVRIEACSILMELCYYKSKTMELSLSKIYGHQTKYDPKYHEKIALDATIQYYYNYKPIAKYAKINIDKVVEQILSDEFRKELNDDKFETFSFPLMSIGCFTKTNFKLVDSKFEEFGKIFKEAMMNYRDSATGIEMDILYDAFSDLVLNNFTYSKTELFPLIDISNIKQKLQSIV
eukprot:gene8348-173_t